MTASDDFIDISIIVATRNRSSGCRRLLQALREQFSQLPQVTFEVVLIFDGCPAYEWLAQDDDTRVRRIPTTEHIGIAQARNAGIAAAHGQLLAFLDDDCVPATTWLSSLLRMSVSYPDHIAFGGKVMGTDNTNLYSQLRDAVYYFETFGAWYLDPLVTADVVGAPYVNGGNSAYRRSPLQDSGGFDPLLPAYSDVELGRRLELDRNAVMCAEMAIHHDHPSNFRLYMERCKRSGRARALLWRHRGYRQDSPARVAKAILANIAWRNAAARRPRISASPARVLAVLLCQEVMHGIGYAQALLRDRSNRSNRSHASRGRPGAAPVSGSASG